MFRILAVAALALVSCTDNNPNVASLSLLNSPSFQGKAVWEVRFNTLMGTVDILGNCDPRAVDLEASFDSGENWEKISAMSGADANCSDSEFKIPIPREKLSALGFESQKSLRKMIQIRQNLAGAGLSDAAAVTLVYTAPNGPRFQDTRVLLTQAKSDTTAPVQISIKAYLRTAVK